MVHAQVGIGIRQAAARGLQQRAQFCGFHGKGAAQLVQTGAQGHKPQRPAGAELVFHAHRVLAQAHVQRWSADLRGRRPAHAVAQVAVQHQHEFQPGVQVLMHPLGLAKAQCAARQRHRGRGGGDGPVKVGAGRGHERKAGPACRPAQPLLLAALLQLFQALRHAGLHLRVRHRGAVRALAATHVLGLAFRRIPDDGRRRARRRRDRHAQGGRRRLAAVLGRQAGILVLLRGRRGVLRLRGARRAHGGNQEGGKGVFLHGDLWSYKQLPWGAGALARPGRAAVS
ncbi:hypothetical protein G6F57_017386 [Rhizopus arrhizus]|nr:hypothetical protein G6F57_017386 [Rhizopus arrhizus]